MTFTAVYVKVPEGYVGFEVPKFISLGVIVVIFGIALSYALLQEKKEGKGEPH